MSESAEKGKNKQMFSDLSLLYDFGTMPQQGLVIVEIKPPLKAKNDSRPDLVKLAIEMKELAIDKMVADKMDNKNITVVGDLIEGTTDEVAAAVFLIYTSRFPIVIDLMYQAIYRLIPLSMFF